MNIKFSLRIFVKCEENCKQTEIVRAAILKLPLNDQKRNKTFIKKSDLEIYVTYSPSSHWLNK